MQRQVGDEEEEELLQGKPASDRTPQVTPGVASTIATLRGGGQPLSVSARAFFEPRFDADFSQVRIHSGARAADLAKAVNAEAFTVGRDVVFPDDMDAHATFSGRRLLAHELTHVVQQGATGAFSLQRKRAKGGAGGSADLAASGGPRETDDAKEREVEDAALIASLMVLDPVRVHLSDADLQRIVDAGQFEAFLDAHDLLQGWLGETGDSSYAFAAEKKRSRGLFKRDRSALEVAAGTSSGGVPPIIYDLPDRAELFYGGLRQDDAIKARITAAASVDFSRVLPDALTESELASLFDTGRFAAFVDFHGLLHNFTHAQTGELKEPANLEEFNDMRLRVRDATPPEVVERFKSILLGYLVPTVVFYDQHLLRTASIGSRGIPVAQGLLDLFTLYLQTRSMESLAEALAVYFGVHDSGAGAASMEVASAFFGFFQNARAMGARSRAAEDPPSRIEAVLDTLPEGGQQLSTARPFDELGTSWGAIASMLLNDLDLAPLFLFGIPSTLPPCDACHGEELFNIGALDLELVERAEKRRADTAALTQRVQGLESLYGVYGIIHLFKDSAKDRAYLYQRVIGIPESLVDAAANAPQQTVRQDCPTCHGDSTLSVPVLPAGTDATESEWMLAVTLASARQEQEVWDMAVSILMVGGSIGAALAAGALSGGIGWAAVPAAMVAAGGATAVTSLYEVHEVRITEQAASAAHAAQDLFPGFGLGSEENLILKEKELAYAKSAGIGNVVAAIALAPISGPQGYWIKQTLAAMAMGGLDGFCSWLVDKRLNNADFLVEAHALKGGAPETAPTAGGTLVMSISAGAVFGGVFEGGIQGIHATGRLFFHVEAGSGRTRVSLEDGTDVTAPFSALDQQLREGSTETEATRGFIDQILARSKQLEQEPLLPDPSHRRGKRADSDRGFSSGEVSPSVGRVSEQFALGAEPHHLALAERNGKVVVDLCSGCGDLIDKIERAIGEIPNSPSIAQLNDLLVDVKYLNQSWSFLGQDQADKALAELTERLIDLGQGSPDSVRILLSEKTQDLLTPLLQGRGLSQGPSTEALLEARKALADGTADKEHFQVLLSEAVKDARTYLRARNVLSVEAGGSQWLNLTSKVLAGACGLGRDCSGASLSAIASQSLKPIQISRFHTWKLFREFLEMPNLDVTNHAFSVITFPDGSKYLVDPTFSQFESVVSRVDVRGFATNLIRDGFMPFDDNNAALYAMALWRATPEKTPLHESFARQLGHRIQEGEHALKRETVGKGQEGVAYRLPEGSDLDILSVEELLKYAKRDYLPQLEKMGNPDNMAESLKTLIQRLETSAGVEVTGSDFELPQSEASAVSGSRKEETAPAGSDEITREIPELLPDDITEESTKRIQEEIPDDVTEEVPRDMTEEVTEKMPGRILEEDPTVLAARAQGRLAEEFAGLRRSGVTGIFTVEGVEFSGVQITLADNILSVRVFGIENVSGVRGRGRQIFSAFEQAAIEAAREAEASSARILLEKTVNASWRTYLAEEQGYRNIPIDKVGKIGFESFLGKIFPLHADG